MPFLFLFFGNSGLVVSWGRMVPVFNFGLTDDFCPPLIMMRIDVPVTDEFLGFYNVSHSLCSLKLPNIQWIWNRMVLSGLASV